ncbi:ParE family toxin-like protein [Serratia liquefaciens]|nr:hypothetical protein M495_19100 [Serratia liquefaciens ATCC 27592]CAI1003916.1 Uncharacterised protein [Serratia liquefaciens]CAI2028332.1 Uncharacterised protein [Serratia liquefaciens]CAI2400877.1 Uncharacterised protein [Serratia liquefaciens]
MSVNLNNAPSWITAKALEILNQFSACQIFPRKNRGKKYFTFQVNKRWRLLSKDDSQNLQLLTHNDYNSEINI